jgi:hypothetical protein
MKFSNTKFKYNVICCPAIVHINIYFLQNGTQFCILLLITIKNENHQYQSFSHLYITYLHTYYQEYKLS